MELSELIESNFGHILNDRQVEFLYHRLHG